MKTQELDDLLHAHFIRPDDRLDLAGAGAVYLTEVTCPDGSGRRADAVHVGLWNSRGAGQIDVCELKVSRSDFRKEIDAPAKAEAWWPYCNAFWIVAPSIEVAPPEELPDGWGLMVPPPPNGRRRKFKTIVEPRRKDARITPGLLVTLLKNTETTRTKDLAAQERKLRHEFYEREKVIKQQRGVVGDDVRRKLNAIEELEGLMGLKLESHSWRDGIKASVAAEGLKAFMEGQKALDEARANAEYAARELERASQNAAQEASRLRKALNLKKRIL